MVTKVAKCLSLTNIESNIYSGGNTVDDFKLWICNWKKKMRIASWLHWASPVWSSKEERFWLLGLQRQVFGCMNGHGLSPQRIIFTPIFHLVEAWATVTEELSSVVDANKHIERGWICQATRICFDVPLFSRSCKIRNFEESSKNHGFFPHRKEFTIKGNRGHYNYL